MDQIPHARLSPVAQAPPACHPRSAPKLLEEHLPGNAATPQCKITGRVGISAGFGSQVTVADDVDIIGHVGPGLDIYSNSQLNFFGKNLVSQNGLAADPRSAGIRLDGNSRALKRGGQISSNLGVGILALVNSSVDFSALYYTGATGELENVNQQYRLWIQEYPRDPTPHYSLGIKSLVFGSACKRPS